LLDSLVAVSCMRLLLPNSWYLHKRLVIAKRQLAGKICGRHRRKSCTVKADQGRLKQAAQQFAEGEYRPSIITVFSVPDQPTRLVCSLVTAPVHQALEANRSNHLAGIEQGMDEDECAAMQLGAIDATGLTKEQRYYLDKVKAKLAEVPLSEHLLLRQHRIAHG
jgi:hypothetical protein